MKHLIKRTAQLYLPYDGAAELKHEIFQGFANTTSSSTYPARFALLAAS